ncbi:adenine phosphoribosyltransferase 4-like [Vigna umbellata]|uniref:adenine phosphoribosyltransferase 4-like n=1 Tax=Vigna umbellata TaxID=87088 RepID=UPI001F5E3AA0|nr:adenine phosphoribosyltransferase 4-like [Vigna umbellata]
MTELYPCFRFNALITILKYEILLFVEMCLDPICMEKNHHWSSLPTCAKWTRMTHVSTPSSLFFSLLLLSFVCGFLHFTLVFCLLFIYLIVFFSILWHFPVPFYVTKPLVKLERHFIGAGIEARGFIFGPPIALAIGAKFVPLRKPKKLPGKVISQEYILEYGRDCLEMHVGAVESGERALVVDDLIATGGTLCAAMDLLERVGAEVVECACVIELPEMKGRERLNGKPLYVLVEYKEK